MLGLRFSRDVTRLNPLWCGHHPRRPIKTHVRPRPVHEHDKAVSEADQEVDVDEQPEQPCEQAAEAQVANDGQNDINDR